MRALQAQGWGAAVQPPPDPLTPACQMAIDCWAFCGGWQPDVWPVYEALNPVPDWHHHIELLRVLRAEAQRAQQQQPPGAAPQP